MTTASLPTATPPRIFDLDRYLHHFFLICEPFSLTPDPEFLFLSDGHEDALAAIEMGVMEKRGLTVLTGEVGTGKTTLARWVLSEWEDHLETAYLSTGTFTFDDILRNTLDEFGLPAGGSREERLTKLQGFLERSAAEGKTVVLLIDEAQNIPNDTFEQLRLLLNFETSKDKLFQLVLIGQPELDRKLRRASLRHIEGRIAVRARLRPLQPKECARYIEHRLNVAGTTSEIFGSSALKTIVRESRGIPRRLNVLCHNALLFAFGQDQQRVTKATALQAVRQMNATTTSGRSARGERPRWIAPAAVGTVALLALALVAWWGWSNADRIFAAPKSQPAAAAAGEAASVGASPPATDAPPPAMVVASLETETWVAPSGLPLAEIARQGYGAAGAGVLTALRAANPEVEDVVPAGTPVELPVRILVDGRAMNLKAGFGAGAASVRGDEDVMTYRMPPGSSLWQVIVQTYGRYDAALLRSVLELNPEISDVRQIEEGTMIRLPNPSAPRR